MGFKRWMGWIKSCISHHNGGANWNNLTGNLPNLPCNIVKYDDGTNGGIYVGTDIGVYYRDNDLGNWIQFMNNLPNVIVNDLEIHEASMLFAPELMGEVYGNLPITMHLIMMRE